MQSKELQASKFNELKELLSNDIMVIKICADDDKSDYIEVFKFDAVTDSERSSLIRANKAENTLTTYFSMQNWSACDYLHLNYLSNKGSVLVMIEETSLLDSFNSMGANKLLKKRVTEKDIKQIIKSTISGIDAKLARYTVADIDTQLTEKVLDKIFFKSNYIEALADQLSIILDQGLQGREDKDEIVKAIAAQIDVKLTVNSLIEENRTKMESSLLLLYIMRDQEKFRALFPLPIQHYFVIYHSADESKDEEYGNTETGTMLGVGLSEFNENIATGLNQVLKSKKIRSDNIKGGLNIFFGGILNGYDDLKEFISNPNEM